jgi:hypothetical protein
MYSYTIPSTLALDEGRWSKPRPGRSIPGKEPVFIVWEAGWGPRTVLDECGKSPPPPPGFDPRNVQPVESPYTD